MVQFNDELDGFLDHSVKIYRSDNYSINTYGEVIPDTLSLKSTTTMRIEPARSERLTTMLQGQEVIITDKGFAKSTENIQIGDTVEDISTGAQYLVVLLNDYYDKASLDHFEVYLKQISNL